MEKIDTAILVLLYGREPSDSKTLRTLSKSGVNLSGSKLVIWNNGPSSLKQTDLSFLEGTGLSISIEQTIHNESLAVIYNRFIASLDAQKFIFLDHDSDLNSAFLSDVKAMSDTSIGVPKITRMGQITSPTVNDMVYVEGMRVSEQDRVVSIGSGLTVGREVLDILSQQYGKVFDERFFLYGVDSTFFYRVYDANLIGRIEFISGFEHSLSRLEEESQKIKEFRRIERGCDRALTLRYYSTFKGCVYGFIMLSLLTLKKALLSKDQEIDYRTFVKTMVKGKHYRSVN